MKRLWWVFLPLASVAIGCASSVPVECPEGYGLTAAGADCEIVPGEEPGPDGGSDGGTEDTSDGGTITPLKTCDEDCDDGNECTNDGCDDGECTSVPAEDGTACVFEDGAGICEASVCVRDCEIEDCREVYPCTEQGLRDAVHDGGDTVIACNGPETVSLTDGPLEVTIDLRIDGLGKLTIDGGQRNRIFSVREPAIFEVIGMGMTGGNASDADPPHGGAIRGAVGTEITVRDCQIYGNVTLGNGGGVNSSDDLSIIGSVVTDNEADGHGGGVSVFGDALIQNSVISNNSSGNRGGGLALWKQTLVENSTISRNHATADGGGVYVTYSQSTGPLTVTIRDSELSANSTDGSGGAIWSSGMVVIQGGAIRDNVCPEGGGAIRNYRGSVAIEGGALFASNSAGIDGGAIASFDTSSTMTIDQATFTGNSTGTGSGGAILNDKTPLVVTDSVFDANQASNVGGAIYAKASEIVFQRTTFSNNRAKTGGAFRVLGTKPLRLENCTISGNQATSAAGAFAAKHAPVTMVHTTVTGNSAALTGSGPHLTQGAELRARHSVIDNGCYADPDSLFVSLGYNGILTPDLEQCVLAPVDGTTTDLALSSEEFNLGPLEANGGTTQTHILGIGSALIDAIPMESCLPDLVRDQRDEARDGTSPCDIGAVEIQPGE